MSCSLGSLCRSCAPTENPKAAPASLRLQARSSQSSSESQIPEGCTNSRLCQTALLDTAWSKCFMKYFFPFPSLCWAAASALGLSGLKKGETALPGVFLKKKLCLQIHFKGLLYRGSVYCSLM